MVRQMSEKTKITARDGHEYDYNAAVNLMDRELCEELHMRFAPCSEQDFYDAYCKAHEEKFGEEFVIN